MAAVLDEVLSAHNGRMLYRGYADDARNTDNAWLETMCMHFHVPDALAGVLDLSAGGEAAQAKWVEVSETSAELARLSGFHRKLVETAAAALSDGDSSTSASAVAQARRVSEVVLGARPLEQSLEAATSTPSASLALGIYGLDASAPLVAARRQLNGRSGRSLDTLGASSHWRASVASGTTQQPTAGSSSVDQCALSLEAALDTFTIASAQLPIVRLVLDHLAVAECDSPSSMEPHVREICHALAVLRKQPSLDMVVEANVFENLHALLPWGQHVPPLRRFMESVFERSPGWRHDTTGKVDFPPTVTLEESVELNAEQRMHLKRLVFVLEPPSMLSAPFLHSKCLELFQSAANTMPPTTVITVGAPGSGKSYVATHHFLDKLTADGLGPPRDAYMTIDPDFWLTNVCQNDNGCRNVANYLNHESFLLACRLRKHMIFDGTGRSLENTCGRVVSRLKAAGYRIYFCIVVASYKSCLSNIAERYKRTGRNVPDSIVRSFFPAIRASATTYVTQQRNLAEQVCIYINEDCKTTLGAVVRDGQRTEEAVALLDQYLSLPPDGA